MKKPKSIFSDFEAHEVKHTASIEGGYGGSSGGGGTPCGTTQFIKTTAGPSGMTNYPDAQYPDGTYGDHNPDC